MTTATARIQLRARSTLRSMRGMSDGVSVDGGVSTRHVLRRELLPSALGSDAHERGDASGGGEQIRNGVGERARGTFVYQDARLSIADHVHHPAGGEGHDRRAAELRFHGDQSKAFLARGN